MVEAVVVLPVLGAVLVGLMVLHEAYAAKLRAAMRARDCGFAHALDGCQEAPSRCERDPEPHDLPAPGPELEVDAIARRQSGDPDPDVFEQVPELRQASASLLGTLTHATAGVRLTRRNGAHEQVESEIVLLCNERPRAVLDLAREWIAGIF